MKLFYFLVVLSHLSFWTGCVPGNTPTPTLLPPTSTSTSQSSWRYYDGMLYMLAMLHASGKFKMYIAN